MATHSLQQNPSPIPLRDERRIRRETAKLIRQTIGHDHYGVVLFGSHARGTAGTESDWDVAVLLEEAGGAARARGPLFRAFSEFETDHGIRVDIIVLDPDTAAKSAQLVRNINDEGVPL